MDALSQQQKLTQSPLFRFILLQFVCLVLMIADKNSHITQPLRQGLSWLAVPLIKVVDWPQQLYQTVEIAIARQAKLIDENNALKQQLLTLQLKAQRNTTLSTENQRLRAMLNTAQELPMNTSVAFVTDIAQTQKRQHIVINQGQADGLFLGQPVLSLSGVVGQVDVLAEHYAHVIVITDPAHVIPAEILRTGLRTLAYGDGDDLLLKEVPISADIRVDDVLITSGFGNRFPRGLTIANLTDVSVSAERDFQVATANPTAVINQLTEVFLIWPDEPTP
ncbi:cell shape-determining protein MreC [Marinicella pacifica]|uniref:Cell shape-determining protein MreC n=1 Tax=Marinicella pacifica TaxID=1171543 RepID=A0A917CRX5_9GAMM|nr:rod shape-determining protein MreC [Marinicella pacifica]GGF94436.1 cell shape-determining protein MreC [Marinicella pacifica]